MTDVTPDILVMQKSPHDERDFLYDQICAEHPPLPKTFSLRENMFPVRQQGQQGSCVAQTLAAIQEYNNQGDILLKGHLSPQFIYDCRPRNIRGMNCRSAMKFLHQHGVPLEKTHPYRNNTTDIKPKGLVNFQRFIKDEAYVYRTENYAQVLTVYDLKNAIYNDGPCLISVPVYGKIVLSSSKKPKYRTDVDMWQKKNGYQKVGGHAMTVVGWDLNGFIIRNSWGPSWGNRGHCNFPFNAWGRQYEVWSAVDHINSSFVKPNLKDSIADKVKKCLDSKRWG
tara:strand:- start:5397 stop:6239 length:843 start_codon:yes stop_codon:yes gene_type:complete